MEAICGFIGWRSAPCSCTVASWLTSARGICDFCHVAAARLHKPGDWGLSQRKPTRQRDLMAGAADFGALAHNPPAVLTGSPGHTTNGTSTGDSRDIHPASTRSPGRQRLARFASRRGKRGLARDPPGPALAATPPLGAGLSVDPPPHHHRFQRVPAGAGDRRARRSAVVSATAASHPSLCFAAIGQGIDLGVQHARAIARRRRHPLGLVWALQRWHGQACLPPRLGSSLRRAHADHLRHSLQLVPARRQHRRLPGPHPQFPSPRICVADAFWRFAGGDAGLRTWPRSWPAALGPPDLAPAPCHVFAHGALGLPKRCPSLAVRELQRPRRLCGIAAASPLAPLRSL